MALPTWPTSLPIYFEADTLVIVPQPQKIITRTEVGPSRSRRRSTLRIYHVTGDLFLSVIQRDRLLEFYHTTLGGGTLRFTWTHPWNISQPVTMKFIGDTEPPIRARNSLVFFGSCQLEMVL